MASQENAELSPRERVMRFVRKNAALDREGLADAIRGQQQRLLDAAARVPDADAREGESWSLKDMLRHVIDGERRVTAQVRTLESGDATNVYHVAPGTQMQIEDTGQTLDELLDLLQAANAALIETVLGVPANVDLSLTSAHEYFGPMNALEWAAFEIFHDWDHTEYIESLTGPAA